MLRVSVVALVEAKLQMAPVGSDVGTHAKVTAPVNPFCGAMVIVVELLLEFTVAVNDVELGERVKLGCPTVACQEAAKLAASTEPRPVTRL
jgi:hypothetical protein